jgi:uncharacterized protein YcnI
MRRLVITTFALAAWTWAVASADAHVEVSPTEAAPGDAVQFELLVPNERSQSTVGVSLQIPKGVLPFSFQDPPGWTRKNELAGDGSIKVVRWRGRLAKDGFTQFQFLASTPEQQGPISWKSTQTYADGKEVAWIGPPDSEEPASVTTISADAPRQNAGGEAAKPASGAGSSDQQSAAADSGSGGQGDDNRDWLAVALGAGGLVLGAAALVVALRRRGTPSPRS